MRESFNLDSNYSHFIHGATEVNDRLVKNQLEYAESIVQGVRNSLEASIRSGVSKFVLLSSGAVYLNNNINNYGLKISEQNTSAPVTTDSNSVYGNAKRYSETLCAIYSNQYDIEVKIARIFSVVGDEMPLDGQYAIGNFVRDALMDDVERIKLDGDGSEVRSYLHVDDVANWVLSILENGEDCQFYNVGSESELSVLELAKKVRDILSPSKEITINVDPAKTSGRSYYVPDCSLIKKMLGVEERYSYVDVLYNMKRYKNLLNKKMT